MRAPADARGQPGERGSAPDGAAAVRRPAPTRVRAERTFAVDPISRVEGEGRLRVVVRGDEVVSAELSIFEAPRFFERLVVGRPPDEVLDMVARICGICPVAYQMTAVEGFERLFGVTLEPQVRQLRRLFYWGEWLQSHALHIYLLHAPDFLGYDSAIEMARDHRRIVERGLSLKQAGVDLLSLLGGRAVHPVGMRVGGFYRVPGRAEAQALLPELEQALADAQETVRWTAAFALPDLERDPLMLSLVDRDLYALDTGRLVTTDGIDIDPGAWDSAFTEHHVAHSTALQATSIDGKHHLVGPSARIVLAGEGLHPLAREALEAAGGSELVRRNMFAAIMARERRADPCRRRGHRPSSRPTARRMPHPWLAATRRCGGLVDGGTPRRPLPPLRGRRAWSRHARPDRAADIAEPGLHRGRHAGLRGQRHRPAGARGGRPAGGARSAATTPASAAPPTSWTSRSTVAEPGRRPGA